MSDLAGQLDIRLQTGAAGAVEIRSSRPLAAARVFAGKPVTTVAAQLPLLYSICATAQAVACVGACEAALGLTPTASARRVRALLLRAETVKEHLWRLLLDWPKALAALAAADRQAPPPATRNEPAMAAALRAFVQLRGAATSGADPFQPGADPTMPSVQTLAEATGALVATAAEQVFGAAPQAWLADIGDEEALRRWAEQTNTVAAALVRGVDRPGLADLGRSEIATLPAVGDSGAQAGRDPDLLAYFARALDDINADAFVAAPTLNGQPAETTPFGRETRRAQLVAELSAAQGNGLLPRVVALLVELARACSLLTATSDPDIDADTQATPGCAADGGGGIGSAAAARGLLVHRVELDAGAEADTPRVQSYRILAPTEWNFHPAGAVAAGLRAIAAAPRLDIEQRRARAGLLITAVDPCVDYRLALS